jgi:hypothetical protein
MLAALWESVVVRVVARVERCDYSHIESFSFHISCYSLTVSIRVSAVKFPHSLTVAPYFRLEVRKALRVQAHPGSPLCAINSLAPVQCQSHVAILAHSRLSAVQQSAFWSNRASVRISPTQTLRLCTSISYDIRFARLVYWQESCHYVNSILSIQLQFDLLALS